VHFHCGTDGLVGKLFEQNRDHRFFATNYMNYTSLGFLVQFVKFVANFSFSAQMVSLRMAMSLTLQNPPSLACFRCYDGQHLFGADGFMRQHICLRAIVNVVRGC